MNSEEAWCAASGTDLIFRVMIPPHVLCALADFYQVSVDYILGRTEMYCEGNAMGRFEIPSTPPTVNKTIRFPSDVVEEVEKAIQSKNCTFSAFVIAAVRMALEEVREADTLHPDQQS